MKPIIVVVNDKMQKKYTYTLTEPVGDKFDPGFEPQLSPQQMLSLGVFGGRYMRDCQHEFPKDWFINAKLYPSGLPGHDKKLNYSNLTKILAQRQVKFKIPN